MSDAPALGGVYKLVETMEGGKARPTVKLSTGKRTFPGRKQVWRVTEGGIASHDVMGLEDETTQDGRALLSRVMRRGVRVAPAIPLVEVRQRCRARVAQLPAAVRALETGAPYAVRVSGALDALARSAVTARRQLIPIVQSVNLQSAISSLPPSSKPISVSSTRAIASTTIGSNCRPASRRSSSMATRMAARRGTAGRA